MQVTLEERSKVWRGRGRPPRQIPEQVRQLADATYRTGKVGCVTISDSDKSEVTELVRMLRSYARQTRRHVRIQQSNDRLCFEMVDR